MRKIVKNNLGNFLIISIIFSLIGAWFFASRLTEVKADTTDLTVTSCDVSDSNSPECYEAISADGGASFILGKNIHLDAPFQTVAASSINSATLYYDSWGSLSGTWEIHVKDARDGTTICSENPAPEPGSETTHSLDCSSITPAQLSAGVWLYIINNDDKGPENVNLDYVRLYVDYAPAGGAATWLEALDTPASGINKETNVRLRIEVANTGGSDATDYDYRLEYAAKNGSCGAFAAVPVSAELTGQHFVMSGSIYVSNGDSTTAQFPNSEGYSFVPGKIVADPANSSGSLTLLQNEYTEIEFVLAATSFATDGGAYCFRLTNAGAVLDDYSAYPELTIAP